MDFTQIKEITPWVISLCIGMELNLTVLAFLGFCCAGTMLSREQWAAGERGAAVQKYGNGNQSGGVVMSQNSYPAPGQQVQA